MLRSRLATAAMLAGYHKTVAKLKSVEVLGTIFGRDAEGRAVVVAPAYYINWSQGLDRFSARE